MEALVEAAKKLESRYNGVSFNYCERDGGYEVHFMTTSGYDGAWCWGETLEEAAQKALEGIPYAN